MSLSVPLTTYHDVALPNGVKIHYRASGTLTAPVVLLLHGYPSSSHQFRHLIPRLATKYRVIAPDLPGFGDTTHPTGFKLSFDSLTDSVEHLLEALKITSFVMYVFDYGAPTGFRLALRRPNAVRGVVTQNGNAYEAGFGAEFWAPLKNWWATGTNDKDDPTRVFLQGAAGELEFTRKQYINGTPADRLERIDPTAYSLDYLQNVLPLDKREDKLDLFYDYKTNLPLYPSFQAFLRDSKVPVLAVWGKNDPVFIPPGAEAFKQDVKDAEVHLLDGGHFLLETHLDEVATLMNAFLARLGQW